MEAVTQSWLTRLVAVMVGVTVLLLLLSGAVALLVDVDATPTFAQLFDVDGEGNLPTWWNTVLLASVGALAWVGSRVAAQGPRQRRGWLVIGVVALLLSFDEAARLHERSSILVSDLSIGTFPWLVVGAVVALTGTGVLVLETRSMPAEVRRRLGAALSIYLSGALGLEAVSGFFVRRDELSIAGVLSHVEEGMEMGACILAIWALLAHLLPLSAVPGRQDGSATGEAPSSPGAPQGQQGAARGGLVSRLTSRRGPGQVSERRALRERWRAQGVSGRASRTRRATSSSPWTL